MAIITIILLKKATGEIRALKWFFKRLCGSTKNHQVGNFIGSLKNSLRKWFFKEPWFERFSETRNGALKNHF